MTDLVSEDALRVLSFTLNMVGLGPGAGDEAVERGGTGAGEDGAGGLLRDSSGVDPCLVGSPRLRGDTGESGCFSLEFAEELMA